LSALGASSRAVDRLESNARTRDPRRRACARPEPRILRYGVRVPARPDSVRAVRAAGRDGRAFARASFDRLARDSLDCGTALASTARPPHWLFGGRRLAAPRVTDRPRLVGWSSLCHARRRCLTPLVVVAGTAPPAPCRQRSCSGARAPARVDALPELTRVTKTAPRPSLAGRSA